MTFWSNLISIIAFILAIGSIGLGVYGGWSLSRAEDTDSAADAKKILMIAGGAFIAAILFFVLSTALRPAIVMDGNNPVIEDNQANKKQVNINKNASSSQEVDKLVSCNANKIGDVCQADVASCQLGEFCGSSDCLCHPVQGFGAACDASPQSGCQADGAMCGESLSCDSDKDCKCFGAPIIKSISPVSSTTPTGAEGDLITINGLYFGSSNGEVLFTNDKGEVGLQALPASSVNSVCVNSWQDGQIVVVVPKGAKSGAIKVVRADGEKDSTNDDRGVKINNFIITSKGRQGICQVNPDKFFAGNIFVLFGKDLTNRADVVFDYNKNFVLADNVSAWTATSVKAVVPLINYGNHYVSIVNGTTTSNALKIGIDRDQLRPYISNISPESGPISQYVTISGDGFGLYNASTSWVKFINTKSKASTTFNAINLPKGCVDRWWYDKHLVVKIPVDLTVGSEYKIQVGNASNQYSPLSEKSFVVKNGQAGPGICYIDPYNSQIGFPIGVYGDRFGGSRTGNEIQFSDNKIGIYGTRDSWSNQKLEVRVPSGAVTGQVQLKNQSGIFSNAVPFKVGKCLRSSDCDASESCCGDDTFWAGTCRRDGACDRLEPGRSAYGWTFSTSLPHPTTCGGYTNSDACVEGSALGTCPNSPGQCQVSENKIVGNGCGDGYCSYNYAICATAGCKYDLVNNKCEVNNLICGSGQSAGASSTEQSNECPDGFDCKSGKCVSVSTVCPSGSSCNKDNQCMTGQSTCECCCQVGNDQSCCTGLTCTPGNCGKGLPDSGLCTGCRRDLNGDGKATTKEEISASNDACNCVAGSDNRYCDVYDDRYPQGVCKDRAKTGDDCRAMMVTATSTCNNKSFSPCADGDYCDPNKGCTCQTYAAAGAPCSGRKADLFHINPFNKSSLSCSNDNSPCNESEGYTCDPTSCTCQASGGQAGTKCVVDGNAGCASGSSSCAQNYQCLSGQQTDCRCCCNPTPDANGKVAANGYGLSCYADKLPCAGEKRGLFCGCTSDEQCDGGGYAGCSADTCCRERPLVEKVDPADKTEGVCRNVMISATFNQIMNSGSFTNNVLLVGDYGSAMCPKGKQFLSTLNQSSVIAQSSGLFNKILAFIKNLLPSNEVRAAENIADQHNFCSVHGVVSSYIESGDDKTTITFSPSEALDAGVNYSVIIKGDDNTKDSVPSGVLSEYGIGLSYNSTTTLGNVIYKNSYIWQFKTLGQDAANGGICALDHIYLSPKSYLFQTSNNDIKEDDSSKLITTFDTAADRDKLFFAKTISKNGQNIAQIKGYSWKWDWTIDNPEVASIVPKVNGLNENEKLVQAMPDIKDSKTYLNSSVEIVEDIYTQPSTKGEKFKTDSQIWVFVCDNPWPAVTKGEWNPWTDRSNNCTVGVGGCADAGFQMYYCRDSGKIGTADDLPAILSDKAVIRRASQVPNIFKEFYFLREALPATSSSFSVVDATIGKSVSANWSAVPNAIKYKLYYGTKSKNYTFFVSVASTSAMVTGLVNDTKYYFAVTSLNERNVESPYSEELSVVPTNTSLPPTPVDVKASIISNAVKLSWQNNNQFDYKVYYGSKSKTYGGSENVGKQNEYSPSGLVPGNKYYFVVSAVSSTGKESAFSSEVSAVVPFNK